MALAACSHGTFTTNRGDTRCRKCCRAFPTSGNKITANNVSYCFLDLRRRILPRKKINHCTSIQIQVSRTVRMRMHQLSSKSWMAVSSHPISIIYRVQSYQHSSNSHTFYMFRSSESIHCCSPLPGEYSSHPWVPCIVRTLS